jgi:hypothetical protein
LDFIDTTADQMATAIIAMLRISHFLPIQHHLMMGLKSTARTPDAIIIAIPEPRS